MTGATRGALKFTVRHAWIAAAALAVAGCQQATEVQGSADDAALTVVVPTGQSCSPTGKHYSHRSLACATCHQCAGTLSFDAARAGPSAAFDATTKNCSNIQCHGVTSGTFTYATWDWGADELVYVSVPYGGSSGSGAPNWYSAGGGSGCNACHGYPPTYNGAAYAWHSGSHGYGLTNGNACQLCHPGVSGAYVWGGPPSFASTSAGLVGSCAPGTYCSAPGVITGTTHGNGTLDVTPAWDSRCIGCH